ncbi:hypothetical protein PENSPDRAFT_759631 [Peniophora sp. CONT]|nr:hypothetical protein PENSPDRAFT_759631 [Peniophora sp. CONT]
MSNKLTVFFLGPTGYIGGSVLELLLQDSRFEITALVRDPAKAKILTENFGVRTVAGSLVDLNLLTEEAFKADVVINTASVWMLPTIKALLAGAKVRFEESATKPIFIHTSGVAVIAGEDAGGEPRAGQVFVDTDVEAMTRYSGNQPASSEESPVNATEVPTLADLSPQHIHDVVEATIRRASDEGGYVRSYIIYPPCVWGVRRGALVDAGVSKVLSPALEGLAMLSIARGQSAVVGRGLNKWAHVEVHEQADLYKRVLDAALADSSFPSGSEGTYFAENGAFAQLDAAEVRARVLKSAGKSSSAESQALTQEEVAQLGPMGDMIARLNGMNVLCRSERGRRLGWAPVLGTDAFLASVEDDMQARLEK